MIENADLRPDQPDIGESGTEAPVLQGDQRLIELSKYILTYNQYCIMIEGDRHNLPVFGRRKKNYFGKIIFCLLMCYHLNVFECGVRHA